VIEFSGTSFCSILCSKFQMLTSVLWFTGFIVWEIFLTFAPLEFSSTFVLFAFSNLYLFWSKNVSVYRTDHALWICWGNVLPLQGRNEVKAKQIHLLFCSQDSVWFSSRNIYFCYLCYLTKLLCNNTPTFFCPCKILTLNLKMVSQNNLQRI